MPANQRFFDTTKGDILFPAPSVFTADPSSSNDVTQGYVVGSVWFNPANGRVWSCASNSTGAAVWTFDGISNGGIEPNWVQTQFGNGTASFYEEGNLSRQTPATNPGSINNDNVLAVYTVPANSFDIAGRCLNIFAQGDVANNTNSKRIKLWIGCTTAVVGSAVSGGTLIADTGAYTTTGAAGWIVESNVVKTGAAGSNTQRALHASAQIGSVVGALLPSSALTLTESAAILIAVTGDAVTTATDITLQFFEINGMN